MTRVLVVEPDPALRRDLVRAVSAAGYQVDAASRGEWSPEALSRSPVDVAVLDVADRSQLSLLEQLRRSAPGVSVIATGAAPSLELAVETIKLGARDFLRKPFALSDLEAALAGARPLRSAQRNPGILQSEDPAMQAVLRQAAVAARSDATVLIIGESGTGKDRLARFLHEESPRARGPCVAVDCAGLHDGLAESELFGHEAGAFTGATRARSGQVRAAHGGTLVLDQVGEVAPALQPKLLRMLQEREVLPLGAERPVAFDARVVATSQQDLAERVAAGHFREDLYFRLDVIVLRIPPLRERPADLRGLARRLLQELAVAQGVETPKLGEEALSRLERHPFRGNVRELENLMRRAAVLFPGRPVDVQALLRPGGDRASLPAEDQELLNLKELERRTIVRALARSGGNRTLAARHLGISVRTLRNKIRLYDLR